MYPYLRSHCVRTAFALRGVVPLPATASCITDRLITFVMILNRATIPESQCPYARSPQPAHVSVSALALRPHCVRTAFAERSHCGESCRFQRPLHASPTFGKGAVSPGRETAGRELHAVGDSYLLHTRP